MKIIATDIIDVSEQEYDFSVMQLSGTIDFPKFTGVNEIWLFEDDFMDLLSFRTHDTKEFIYFDIPENRFALHIPPLLQIGKKKRIFFTGKTFITLESAGLIDAIL